MSVHLCRAIFIIRNCHLCLGGTLGWPVVGLVGKTMGLGLRFWSKVGTLPMWDQSEGEVWFRERYVAGVPMVEISDIAE